MAKQVELKIYEIQTFRSPLACTVCGELHGDIAILFSGDGDGFGAPYPSNHVRVCRECFEQPELVDATLLQRAVGLEREAADLQQKAAELRCLIGQLKLPSLAKFKAARDGDDAEAA